MLMQAFAVRNFEVYNMNIKRIDLFQSKNRHYNGHFPNSLDSAYEPHYNFEYPFSNEIALDCERAVFLLKEKDIGSELCKRLGVVFVSETECQNAELSDHIITGISELKQMRFVNVYVKKEVFNKMNDREKRRFILDKICDSVILLTSFEQKEQVRSIFDEIYNLADETECEYLSRKTKKYSISVKFKSSLNGRGGYEALLYIKNNKTNKQSCTVLFSNGEFADLEYRIHQIVIKNGKCVIRPKYCEGFYDEEIIVDINV